MNQAFYLVSGELKISETQQRKFTVYARGGYRQKQENQTAKKKQTRENLDLYL